MKRSEIFELVLTSIFVALIFLLGFVPQLGFISIMPGNPITTLHIPVLIAAVLFRTKYAFIPGIAFGVVSLIQAILQPVGLNTAFINPMVSVLPRFLFAVAVHFIFKATKLLGNYQYGHQIAVAAVALITVITIYFGSFMIFDGLDQVWIHTIALSIILLFGLLYTYLFIKHDFKSLVVPSVFILGTLIHTILVLSFAAIFSYDLIESFFPDKNIVETIFFIAGFNGLMEAVVAALVGTPVFLALRNVPIIEQRLGA